MPASRTCPGQTHNPDGTTTNCPAILTQGQRYCPTHQQAYDTRRGTTTQRGYGAPHQTLRAKWATRINAGTTVFCPRCHTPIRPGQAWDLGHTDNRADWTGPEHSSCNRSAGGQAGNQTRRTATSTE